MPPDFTKIEPSDPRHRQVTRAAMKAKDVDALTALKGNTHKPIWLVNGVFLYFLMISSGYDDLDDLNHVAIFLPSARPGLVRLCHPTEDVDPATVITLIPADTYDFAL